MTAVPPNLVRPALFQRARIGRPRVDAFEERHRLRVSLLQPATGRGSLQRKTHLDVGAGEFGACEPFAFRQFAFPVIHVLLELRIDQRDQRGIADLAHQRPQQRRRTLRHQREQQFQQQRRHGGTFGIVQPIGVAQPLRRIRRRDQFAVAIGGDDVFGDRARLRNGVAVVGDDGRFAKRMNGAQFRGRAHVRLALIADDLIGDAEFFEQPQHALRAGIVEMMHRQHGRPPKCRALVPAGCGKVEMAWCRGLPLGFDRPNLPG